MTYLTAPDGNTWALTPARCFSVHTRGSRRLLVQEEWCSCPFYADGRLKSRHYTNTAYPDQFSDYFGGMSR